MQNKIKNKFKESIISVEKHMSDIDSLFKSTKLKETKNNIFIFCFLISLFGKENNIKNILPIIKDIFISNGNFEYSKDILIKKCYDLYYKGELKNRIKNLRYIYTLKINSEKIFSSHTYQDWGKYLKNKNYKYNESLLRILLDIVNLFDNVKDIEEIINGNEAFLKKYNKIRKIGFLGIFRTIFLFDFLKNLFYLKYFSSSLNNFFSLNINDYILNEGYELFGENINYYLLSTYDTFAYKELKNIILNEEFFEYKNKDEIEKIKFIFYLEDSLCWFGKDIAKK